MPSWYHQGAWKICCNTHPVLVSVVKETITYPKKIFYVIVSFMSLSIYGGFSTPHCESKIKTVLGNLAASIHSLYIYNSTNRLNLSLISWRTLHATHIAAGSSTVQYTWSCLHYIAGRGRCTRGESWTWPTILTHARVDVTAHYTCSKLDYAQKQQKQKFGRKCHDCDCL